MSIVDGQFVSVRIGLMPFIMYGNQDNSLNVIDYNRGTVGCGVSYSCQCSYAFCYNNWCNIGECVYQQPVINQ